LPLRRVTQHGFVSTFRPPRAWCNSHGDAVDVMTPAGGRVVLVLLAALAGTPAASAATGDDLCGTKSTPDTCVITGNFSLPDGTALAFTRPNVELRGTLTVVFAGVCSLAPAAACVSDAKCDPPARCLRTGRITVDATGSLTLGSTAQILARSESVVGDLVGPDGGTIELAAHDVTIAGTLDVSAGGATGAPVGNGGTILVHAASTVTLRGRLDASTARGGCGGTITVDGALALSAGGVLDVEGATRGGAIDLTASDYVSAGGCWRPRTRTATAPRAEPVRRGAAGAGSSSARRWSSSPARRRRSAGRPGRSRPPHGRARRRRGLRRGRDADRRDGRRRGRLYHRRGRLPGRQRGRRRRAPRAIRANGLASGFGSDAGAFAIVATGAKRCAGSEALCASAADCGAAEACREVGGEVLVQAPISAAGGAGTGSGCALCKSLPCTPCEIRGSAGVTVTAAVDVSGGRQQSAVGGKLTIAAGRDLTVGPGSLSADAADGGTILLLAGERADSTRDVGGLAR
jgi:hypothetical protein